MSVYFYGCVTMDGYLADKNHSLDWLFETGSIEETEYEQFYRRMDVTLIGRKTFKYMEQQGNSETFYPTTDNYVFTHDENLSANGFIPVRGSVTDFVAKIGNEKNIWVIGGNTLLAPLLDQNMVDHIILQIAPVLLGAGIPLFTQNDVLKRFHLEDVRKYGQFAELIFTKRP